METVVTTTATPRGSRPRPRGAFLNALDDAAKLSTVGLFLLALSFALYAAAEILVPIVSAVIVAFLLNPVAARMERRGLPGMAAAAIIIVALGLLLWLAIYLFSIPLQTWVERLPELASALYKQVLSLRNNLFRLQVDAGGPAPPPIDDGGFAKMMEESGILSSAALLAPSMLGEFALFVVLLFFLIGMRTQLRGGILALCWTRRARLTAARVLHDSERHVSAYLATITVINVLLGITTGLIMWALGLPSPALWGALNATLNYAPYLGPAVVTVIMAGVGLLTFDSIGHALLPPLSIILLNFVEGNIITPAVLGRRFTVNPLLVLIALAFWLWMWGPVGAFLATPMLIMSLVVITHTALPHIAERQIALERERVRARRRPLAPVRPPPGAAGTVEVTQPPRL